MRIEKNLIGMINEVKDSNGFKYSKSDGLQVYFNPGRLRCADGSYIEFSGGSVNVPNNKTYEILFSLWDKQLHAVPRAIDTGSVHIATVTAANGIITAVKQPSTFVMPRSRIEKTKRKIAQGYQPVSIGLMGDSLTRYGPWPIWYQMLFDSGYSANGYNVKNIAKVTCNNYAASGQTSHYGMALLGSTVFSNQGTFRETAVTYKDYYNVLSSTNKVCKESPVFQNDLVIVEYGQNVDANGYSYGYIENIVRALRKRDIEVIIVTNNPLAADLTSHEGDGKVFKDLAEAYGCEVADTWAFKVEAANNGIDTFYDSVHNNTAGNIVWATRIRSILNDYAQVGEKISADYSQRIITMNDPTYVTKFPTITEVQVDPWATWGSVGSSNISDICQNIAMLLAGKTQATSAQLLATGQKASYGHAGAFACDIIIDQSSGPFKANINSNYSGYTLKSITWTAAASNYPALIEGPKFQEFNAIAGAMSQPSGLQNAGISIDCTEGSMKILAVVFYTYNRKDLRFADVEFVGTWASEAWGYSHPFSRWTDTDGDGFNVTFEGTGIQLLFSRKSAAGKVDVWFDGVQQPQVDLYNNANFLYNLVLLTDRGYGRHTVQVKLNGKNASADAATAATNRRLALLAGYIIDSR